MAEADASCRPYLTLPARPLANLESSFGQAIASADVACALFGRNLARFHESWAITLKRLAHDREIAFFVADDVEFAARIGADGVHIAADAYVYRKARSVLGNRAIVGVNCELSRHDAMVLAEMGADYVAFGVSATSRADGRDRRNALIAWWAETFEVPCVAMDVVSPDEAVQLAQAGADFVALTESIWKAQDAVSRVAAVEAALACVRSAA